MQKVEESKARQMLAESLGWPDIVPDLHWEAIKGLSAVKDYLSGEPVEGSAILSANRRLDDLGVERPLRTELKSTRTVPAADSVKAEDSGKRDLVLSVLVYRIAELVFARTIAAFRRVSTKTISVHGKKGTRELPSEKYVAGWLSELSNRELEQGRNVSSDGTDPMMLGWIHLGEPGDLFFHRFPYFDPEGLLVAIYWSARRIGSVTGWSEGEATAFLLLNRLPAVTQISTKVQVNTVVPSQSRITLAISPLASPREVMDAYAKARRGLFSGRDKPMSGTKLQLVMSIFLRHLPVKGSWNLIWSSFGKDPMATKLGLNPYADQARFKYDTKTAVDSLLDPYGHLGGYWGAFAVGDVDESRLLDLVRELDEREHGLPPTLDSEDSPESEDGDTTH